MSMPAIAVTCQQVTHYHAARFRALARDMPSLQIIAATGDAEMRAVLSRSDTGLAVTTMTGSDRARIEAEQVLEATHRLAALLLPVVPAPALRSSVEPPPDRPEPFLTNPTP